MTAFGTPDVVDGARALGAFEVMPKPFELGAMSSVVHRAYDAVHA